MERLVIGSRGSQLALTQSRTVAAMLEEAIPNLEVSIEVIQTQGDIILDVPLSQIGSKGLFTHELESALLEGTIDLAVHSLKDLPTDFPVGLTLGAVPPREHPGDAFVSERFDSLDALPEGATVGTSSLRRRAQLLAYRSDLCLVDLRGNVDTRLRKIADGEVDAAVLAYAGIVRIGRRDAIRSAIPETVMVPAPAQGALGIEVRDEDTRVLAYCSRIHNDRASAEVTAERACLSMLEGGCQVPIGALARVHQDELTLLACVCSVDGKTVLRVEERGDARHAREIGNTAAARLVTMGAASLIAATR
ncbi:MAG: hydroxymethylbilane synthase [Candidatus Hydrogenedentes bacterium]|nr:hydroxymethylbilane synthase [Candidatus Hydrogenedentota bacterium]